VNIDSKHRDRGLSLIELVVAMSIFALVAIMGLQSLSGMLHTRDRLTDIDDQSAALSRGLGLLRNDLSAVLPLLFYPPDRGAPQSALTSDGEVQLAMSLGGQAELSGQVARHRAEWRVDPQTTVLTRQVWITLTPGDRSTLRPEVTVLDGISGLRLRSYWLGQGWVDGLRGLESAASSSASESDQDGTGNAREVYSDTLPEAIEVTLLRPGGDDITLIESFR